LFADIQFFSFFLLFFDLLYPTPLPHFNLAGELSGNEPSPAPSASSTYATRLQAAWPEIQFLLNYPTQISYFLKLYFHLSLIYGGSFLSPFK
jgi:hypothetical protein